MNIWLFVKIVVPLPSPNGVLRNMKKIVILVVAAMMATMNAKAQRIEVVDDNGNGIPLVSVLTEDGVLIGTTDLNGVLSDVKGARKISLTHVAFKPMMVSVSDLPSLEGTEGGRRVTMEEVDYALQEIVVKPKPYVCMDFYFRGFSYIEDSLRAYAAGIVPVAYVIQENYKGKTRNVWSYGGAANKALSWNTQGLALKAEDGVKKAAWSIETLVEKSKGFKEYYKTSLEPDGENRWLVKNPEGVVGQIQHSDGFYHATLDAGKIQTYANKANGEEKMRKARENRNYDYQYSEVYAIDDEGKIQPYNKIMEMSHWEYDASKGRTITVLYLYATDHSYMDEDEFKAHSKALNKGYVGDMSLDDLEEYERTHNIPALSPEQQKAIRELKKQTGKKS